MHHIWISDHEHKSPIITIKGKDDSLARKNSFKFSNWVFSMVVVRMGNTQPASASEQRYTGVKDGGKAVLTTSLAIIITIIIYCYYHCYFNLRAFLPAASGDKAKTLVLPFHLPMSPPGSTGGKQPWCNGVCYSFSSLKQPSAGGLSSLLLVPAHKTGQGILSNELIWNYWPLIALCSLHITKWYYK